MTIGEFARLSRLSAKALRRLVQSMIDDGSLTEEEAASHPQRALLLRALAGDAGGPDNVSCVVADVVAL
ncbi:hypothetical protein ACQSMD_05845 [Streptomyces flavovirens]|uniref:hypothetical protein n=1 Tax=Streptomyces flavovirens TaxID=52258 RepID=UPI003D0AD52E